MTDAKRAVRGGHPGDSQMNVDLDPTTSKPSAKAPVKNYVINNISSVPAAAIAYFGRGWTPTPVDPGSKRPIEAGWDRRQFTLEEIRVKFPLEDLERNVRSPNVGIVLGQPSNGLVVADLDNIDLRIAILALPMTELIAGRPGNPSSHWFYQVEARFPKVECTSPTTGKRIIELLGDGQQVVVPPSSHPSGECREWVNEGSPLQIDAEELVRVVHQACAFQEIAEIFPPSGVRHEFSLALAGGLLRAGIDEDVVESLLDLIWDTAERGQVQGVVRSTARKLEVGGERVSGWPSVAHHLGNDAKKSVGKIVEWLGVDDFDVNDPRPRVIIRVGDLHHTTMEGWDALKSRNDPPSLFVRAGDPVRIEEDSDSRPIIRDLTLDRMRFHLSELIRWMKLGGKDGKPVPTQVPTDVVKNILATPEPPLPPLKAVVSAPILAPDGEISIQPGYHAASRTFYHPLPGVVIPEITAAPSLNEIERAKHLLMDEMLGDFPFETEAEKANALALILLPFGREMINGNTPFHFIEAPRPGTGKSLLAHVATMLLCGPAGAASISETKDDEEWRKRITSVLFVGYPFLVIDNVTQSLVSSQLAKLATEGEWTDRKLGSNTMVTLPVRCTLIITANNASVSVDIARRSVRIRLNAKIEDPFTRDVRLFRHPNLQSWVTENRGDLIWACLTLWRAWIAAGQPDGGAVMGSFEEWAATMSGLLKVAGVSGFLENSRDFLDVADTDKSRWSDFVQEWWEQFGSDWVKPKELFDSVAFLVEGFDYDGKTQSGQLTAFGMDLKKQRGTLHGELEIVVKMVNDKPKYQLHHTSGEKRKRQDRGMLGLGGRL